MFGFFRFRVTFRDHGYVSAMTGSMARAHHTSWNGALDDSPESYLNES